MIDMVPKAITLTLVEFAKENMQRVLLEHLYSQSAAGSSSKIHTTEIRFCLIQSPKFLRNCSRNLLISSAGVRSASRWSVLSTRLRQCEFLGRLRAYNCDVSN